MKLLHLVIALCLFGIIRAESAQPDNQNANAPTQTPHYHYDWKEELNLTPEQLEVFRKILRDYRLQNRFIQDDYTRLFTLNRNLFDHNTYDFEYYKNQALEIERHRIDVERDFFQKIHAILTPKQREIFARSIEEWSIRR